MTATARKKKAAPGHPDVEYFPLVEQGSDDWYKLRLGTPTASVFSAIIADGKDGDASKMRRDLMYKLAGELLTGRVAEGKVVTPAMMRGHEMEPRARQYYERRNLEPIERIGFMRRLLPSGRYVGASPDGLKNKRREGLEIKTLAPHRMIPIIVLRGGSVPPEHRAQVFGTMMVGHLASVDLQLYYDGMPVQPMFRVERDEKVIKEISDAVEVFDHELHKLVKKIQDMGGAQ